MAFVEKLMFQPSAFHLHTTNPDQRNVSAPWLIRNVPTISEALQAGSLHLWQEQPSPGLAQWETARLWPRRGSTDTTAMQTLSNSHHVTRHWVYNPTLQFWQISGIADFINFFLGSSENNKKW